MRYGELGHVRQRADQGLIAQRAGFTVDGKPVEAFAIRVVGTDPGIMRLRGGGGSQQRK